VIPISTPLINTTDYYPYASNDPSRDTDYESAAEWRAAAIMGLNYAEETSISELALVNAVEIGETVMSQDGYPLGPMPVQVRRLPAAATMHPELQSHVLREYPETPWLLYVFVDQGKGNPVLALNVAKCIKAKTSFTPNTLPGGGVTADMAKVNVVNPPDPDTIPVFTPAQEPPQPPPASSVG
jgi:hypothetical protein